MIKYNNPAAINKAESNAGAIMGAESGGKFVTAGDPKTYFEYETVFVSRNPASQGEAYGPR
jgi:hypothetical protein